MDKDLVSILIPVYNRETLIEETVKSALNQTYINIEIIIVDNKSTDKTWEILQKLTSQDNRIKVFQNDRNIGPVRNWKRCIEEANGVYGKILWSDDLIAPDFLEKTTPYLKNEDIGFVFTRTEIFIHNTDKKTSHYSIGKTGVYKSSQFINGVLFKENYPVSPGCALFKLKDLRKNLRINIPNKLKINFSREAIGNDLLLFLFTAKNYQSFAFVNETLSYFRSHNDSISIQADNGKLRLYYIFAKAYFLEKYKLNDLILYLNYQINLLLIKYNSLTFGINNISDFYLKNKDLRIKKYNPKLGFSDEFRNFYNKIISLKDSKYSYILYGNGTIGKTIQKLIPEKIVAYVDINDKDKHPSTLKNIKYDRIIISVLGREKEIIQYLTKELNIDINKIITIEL